MTEAEYYWCEKCDKAIPRDKVDFNEAQGEWLAHCPSCKCAVHKQVCCGPCSEAGGAGMPIFHDPPECRQRAAKPVEVEDDQ